MAHLKLSELIMDIRGSVRNHVYSAWNGRHYLRSNAELVGNPKTKSQQENVRAPMAELSQDWLKTLNPTQRAGWESFAKDQGSKVSGDKHKGETGIIPENHQLMTGYNAFLMCNMRIYTLWGDWSTQPKILSAPKGVNPPLPPELTSAIFAEETITPPTVRRIIVGMVTPINWGPARSGCSEDGRVRIWLKPQTYYSRIQMSSNGNPATSSEEEIDGYKERGQTQPIEAGKYMVELDAVNAWGLRSASSALLEVIVPQPIIPS